MKHISTFSDKNKPRTSLRVYILIVMAGIAVGSFMIKNNNISDLVFVNQYFIPVNDSLSVFALARGTFVSSLIFTSAAFFFGLCAFGKPFGAMLLLYRSAGIGLSVALVYSCMSKASIFTLIITILPKAIAFSVLAILTVRETFRNSHSIFMFCIKDEAFSENTQGFRLYCIKFIVLIILSLIISVADGGLNYLYVYIMRQ
ncbi:hypothetical protein [Ruminococcus flavefaciens]|uniref:hypothetical protein n=1 Tax=Ruminococcus flavefaciens TaxID=1265 RepID=UPI000490FBCF|nr:hypothetical protein [Ruminococcus flavefaciens]